MRWKDGIIIALISGIVGYLLRWYFSLGSLELPFINGLWIALSFLLGLLGGSDIMGLISIYFKERNEKRATIKIILSEIGLNQNRLKPLADATKVLYSNEETSEENVFPNELYFNDMGFLASQSKIGLLNEADKICEYYNELDVVKREYPKLNIHKSVSRNGLEINQGLPYSRLVCLEFKEILGDETNLSEIVSFLEHTKKVYGFGEELILGLKEQIGIKPVREGKEFQTKVHLQTKTPDIHDWKELRTQISKDKKKIKEHIEKEYGGLPPDFDCELHPDKKKRPIYNMLEEFYKEGKISEDGKIKDSEVFVESLIKDKIFSEMFETLRKKEDDLSQKTIEIERWLAKIEPDFEKRRNELKDWYDEPKDWRDEL